VATWSHLPEGLLKPTLSDHSRDTPGSLCNYFMLKIFLDFVFVNHSPCSTRNPSSTPSENSKMLILQACSHVSHKMNWGHTHRCLSPTKVKRVNSNNPHNYIRLNPNMHANRNTANITSVCMQSTRMYAYRLPPRMYDWLYTLNKPYKHLYERQYTALKIPKYPCSCMYECMHVIEYYCRHGVSNFSYRKNTGNSSM
jgi:hypothetical protein